MSIQLMLAFKAGLEVLQKAHRTGLERELTMLPYVFGIFSTGHDEANREVFLQQDPENLQLVGLALRWPKKSVDKSITGLSLHP